MTQYRKSIVLMLSCIGIFPQSSGCFDDTSLIAASCATAGALVGGTYWAYRHCKKKREVRAREWNTFKRIVWNDLDGTKARKARLQKLFQECPTFLQHHKGALSFTAGWEHNYVIYPYLLDQPGAKEILNTDGAVLQKALDHCYPSLGEIHYGRQENLKDRYSAWRTIVQSQIIPCCKPAILDEQRDWFDTPLFTAIRRNDQEMMDVLIKHGASIYIRRRYCFAPFLQGDRKARFVEGTPLQCCQKFFPKGIPLLQETHKRYVEKHYPPLLEAISAHVPVQDVSKLIAEYSVPELQ